MRPLLLCKAGRRATQPRTAAGYIQDNRRMEEEGEVNYSLAVAVTFGIFATQYHRDRDGNGSNECCFIETFGRLDRGDVDFRIVDLTSLEARCVSQIFTGRPLRLVDLTGPGLRRIGADGRLCTGDHTQARLWAAALWAHSEQPDGILYPARHDLSCRSVALFDRASIAVSVGASRRLIDLPRRQLEAILNRYDFAFAES